MDTYRRIKATLPKVFLLVAIGMVLIPFNGNAETYQGYFVYLTPTSTDANFEKAWFVADTNDNNGGAVLNWTAGEFGSQTEIYIMEEAGTVNDGGFPALEYANWLIVVNGKNDGGTYDEWTLGARVYKGTTYEQLNSSIQFGQQSAHKIWAVFELKTSGYVGIKLMVYKEYGGSCWSVDSGRWPTSKCEELNTYLSPYYSVYHSGYSPTWGNNFQVFADVAKSFSFPDTSFFP
jgi:hypothetical protein